ncbi:hypothetical protein [Microbacterium gubbeenense]|uniref:hypothetical protein n=1 Tax=Microbacterium gubbeenense TaxID=159896 RepID=UPI003F94BC5C
MASSARITRTSHRSRLDIRFLIGAILIVVSIVGVWFVVTSARETTPVLAAAHALVPGQAVTASDVVEIEAHLGAASGGYLVPDDLDDGIVSTRVVAEGEIVPASAITASDKADQTTVVVRSALGVPADIQPGAQVELWAAPAAGPQEFGEPLVIAATAIVADVREDEGVVTGTGATLELTVPREVVSKVLQHVAAGSALSAVPASVPRELPEEAAEQVPTTHEPDETAAPDAEADDE